MPTKARADHVASQSGIPTADTGFWSHYVTHPMLARFKCYLTAALSVAVVIVGACIAFSLKQGVSST